MSGTSFFTICARNYLAGAVTLAKSVKSVHTEADFVIWILDDEVPPQLPEGLKARSVIECMSPQEWGKLLLQYDILEYATAVKPWAFLQHFQEGFEYVIYLDPDIYVYRCLTEVFEALEGGSEAVLTPHITEPLPRDGQSPNDLDILRSGVYNLGFLGLRRCEAAESFVNWWKGWLKTHCFADPSTGVFTDQKWMEFTPTFLGNTTILQHKGYNVAYWNLSQRAIQLEKGGWTAAGDPLVFFHFSGFSPKNISALSKHQTRIRLTSAEPAYQLCEEYATNVQNMGAEYAEAWTPKTFEFTNGARFDKVCKSAYARAIVDEIEFMDIFGTGEGSFYSWMNAPIPEDRGGPPWITRYLFTLYGMRSDVQKAYPDILGADRQGFIAWARKSATVEMGIDPSFIDRAEQLAEVASSSLRYVGYLRSEMGVGEAARGYVRALRSQRADPTLIDVSQLAVHRAQDESLGPVITTWPGVVSNTINIFHINADELPHVMDHLHVNPHPEQYNIGLWAWETLDFPKKWNDRFNVVNEVWAATSFMVEAISKQSPVPVVCIPHVIQVPDVQGQRQKFNLPEDEFLFLFHFDFLSMSERKNPEGLIAAFSRAFKPEEPVRLVIKSINADRVPNKVQTLLDMVGDSRVTFIHETLDSQTRYELIDICDAYVSLHRAEGFGLGIAEAMAMGKPVIATGWSGNMDFMNVGNSLPVRYSLKPLPDNIGPYEKGSLWAEPDEHHAASLMRALFESRELCQELGQRAKADITASCGETVVGLRILQRLERIRELRATHVSSIVPSYLAAPNSIHWAERYARMAWLRTKGAVPAHRQTQITRYGKSILRRFRLME